MSSRRPPQARRVVVRIAAGVALFVAIALIAFLPFAGRYLVVDEPVQKADVLFVLGGGFVDRWLEAVDLYREGAAPRIIISPGQRDVLEDELRRKGIRFPSDPERKRDAMVQLGVPASAITILPRPVDNTAQEAAALRRFLGADTRSAIVVTSKYHTRRARFAFDREFRDSPVTIRLRATRYDTSTPARWWSNRADFRMATSEMQKLLAYRLGLGE
jgi:uncharacterized SAM-binding protein YcdF (DUF218 family)